jgi:hypothetical protein
VYNCNVIVYIWGMVDINLFMGNIHTRKREWSWAMVLKEDYFHRRQSCLQNICVKPFLFTILFLYTGISYMIQSVSQNLMHLKL